MKSVVVEIRGNYAAILSDDGCVSKIKNENYIIGQVIEQKEQKKSNTKKIAALAASLAIVFSLCGGGIWAFNSSYSYVSLDVNPSVEYMLNRFDQVISVNSVNEDGKEIIDDLGIETLNRSKIHDAMSITVSKIAENGFLDEEDGNVVVISTSGKHLGKAGELAETLESRIQSEVGSDIQVHSITVSLQELEKIRKQGMTPGRMHFAKELTKNVIPATDKENTDGETVNSSEDEAISSISNEVNGTSRDTSSLNGRKNVPSTKPASSSKSNQTSGTKSNTNTANTTNTAKPPSINNTPEKQTDTTETDVKDGQKTGSILDLIKQNAEKIISKVDEKVSESMKTISDTTKEIIEETAKNEDDNKEETEKNEDSNSGNHGSNDDPDEGGDKFNLRDLLK